MIKDILKRSTAGLLSALTLLTTVPLSGAVDGGIMPLAEEDNEASSIEINVGEVYNIADKGVQKAWFQQNGAPRNVWPMFTEASDGTEIRAYCADHSKGNPGTSGMPYTVTSRVSDMHVYGVAVRSDARMTLNQFISFAGSPITAENFTADMYFSASQAAIWCALGDAQIAANSSYGVSYGSSTSLGYRAAGKTLSASSTSEALTLFAAIKMLEYGNEFYNTWGPNGKGHEPWVGATINYTPGNAEYTPAAQKTGTIDVGGSIVSGGTFAEKEIDGQQYMVLPMAAASATFVRGDGEYAKIAAALRQVMDSSVGYLARCGLNVVSPGYIDNHLVETVFRMLCKRTSEHIRLPLYFRDMLQECYGVPQQPEPDPEGGEEITTGAAKQDTLPEAKEQKNTGRRRKQQKTSEQFEATGVMDLICPAAVDFTHKDYIEMDGVCHAYLYIAGYGYKSLVRGGWMASLAGMGDGISVSMTLQRRSREKILPKVANSTIWSRSRIRDVDNTRADFEQMDSAITAGIYIKDQMNRAGEDYYDMYTLIEVTADDPELLETRVSDVERHCTSLELIVKRCDYLEEQAFHSFLPVVSMAPEIERKARRNALLSGVASAFPFYSMELCEQNGILIGQDMQRKSICMLDIFDSDRYNNANTIVLGTSGAGKTFLLQLIAMRYRQQGKQVCLIAPYKGYEYRAACEAIGGLYIKLAPSSTDCINFMEIREESLRARQQEESEQERNRSLLADKISQLHIYFSLLRRNLTEEDMEQLDVALTQLYRRFGIYRNNNSLLDKNGRFKPQPTPADFYNLLLEKEETKPLASVLSRFVKGSASNLGKATNIDLRNKYIVLDISEIGKDLLAFGTLLATDICMEYCKQDRAENKIIILDEIWSLIGAGSNSEAATFIQEMFKTVRGYGTAAIGASQDLEDFFALENGKFGKALLNNSRIKFALMTEPEEARLIQQHYHLTDEEMQMHARFSRGQALLCAGLNRLGVDIIASKREHDLITTDHSDLARMRDRRNYERMRQQSAAAWEQEEDYDESAQ